MLNSRPKFLNSKNVERTVEPITIYYAPWCPDCWRAKMFLRERGVEFQEINIEADPHAEDLVMRVNNGKRKIPTVKVGERYFACSPFNAQQLAKELQIPLNK